MTVVASQHHESNEQPYTAETVVEKAPQMHYRAGAWRELEMRNAVSPARTRILPMYAAARLRTQQEQEQHAAIVTRVLPYKRAQGQTGRGTREARRFQLGLVR